MFFSIVKWVIISLTLIFLVHHLYMFLMNTLTVPKIKDLVNKPTQQYKDIFDTIQHSSKNVETVDDTSTTMTAELSSFLNDLKKTTPTKKNNEFETFTNSNDIGYSIY